MPEEVRRMGEMRAKALEGWDKLLTWTLAPRNRDYILKVPAETNVFFGDHKALEDFDRNYGHFSPYHPIVGLYSPSPRDREVTNCLLEAIDAADMEEEERRFAVNEVLAKVVAYLSLEKGMKIPIPVVQKGGKHQIVTYVVDEVIDIWHGMPAFGMIPQSGKGVPILLFRGTDLSLASEKGWASIFSDLDTAGPGYTSFLQGIGGLKTWLKKMAREHEPARLIGFSLGGVFALYTLIHEYPLVSIEAPSVAFNPPGVSEEVLKEWDLVPVRFRPPQITYVNQGDFVSQVGLFLEDVWELSIPEKMMVIQAHLTLISAQPKVFARAVDVEAVNKMRKK